MNFVLLKLVFAVFILFFFSFLFLFSSILHGDDGDGFGVSSF